MFDFLKKHRKKLVYIPLAVYWFLLMAATSLPSSDLPKTNVSDKIEHFAAFFGLAIFLNLTLLFQTRSTLLRKYSSIFTFFIIAVYAGLDEIHQLYIPGRYCDILDWTADIIGACLGILLVVFCIKIFKYKSESQFS